MWFSPDNTTIATFMVFNPTYDFPMFLAYISIVPAMTLLTFYTEARFFKLYHEFYRGIEYHEFILLDQ